MAVFKNGIFAYDSNGQIVNPTTNSTVTVPCGNFFAAVGTLNITQRNAVYQLVTDLQSYNIWSKMKAIYPMVGGTANAHKFNLKDPTDSDTSYRLAFNGGWTHSSTGALPNGVDSYADTFFSPGTQLSTNDSHISFYSRTNTAWSGYDIGIQSGSNFFALACGWSDNKTYYSLNSAELSVNNGSNTSGYFNATIEGTQLNFIKNGTFTNYGQIPVTSSNVNITIGALRNGVTITSYGKRECAFATIGTGLSLTDGSNLYTAVQRFQTTLGRQV